MEICYQENGLTAEGYLAFQRKMGWPQDPRAQIEKSLAHTIVSIVAINDGEIVGMGRLLGDAAIYWYMNDVFILTAYQGRGIGTQIVKRLIAYVKANSLPGTSVSLYLFSAQGKEGFYERLGFRRRPHEGEGAGMELEIDVG